MKKKIMRIFSLAFVVIMMVSMLTACGGGSGSSYDSMSDMKYGNSIDEGSVGGFGSDWLSDSKSEMSEDANPESAEPQESEGADSARKIIERIGLSVQTKEFDKLMQDVDARIAEFNGYIESSNIYGNGFDSYGSRDARMVIRIPSGMSDAFIDFVSENSAVTSKNVDTDDVTLQYVDVESRIKVLLLEKEQLEKLLAEATTMEDIIYVQDKLMDVIYELESAQSQLRTYDNLIDYTTITLNIYEVERTMVVEEQTVWQEIATKFNNNIEDITDDIVDLFIYVVANSPYLCIYAVVIVIIVILIKKGNKKAKARMVAAKQSVVEKTEVSESNNQDVAE